MTWEMPLYLIGVPVSLIALVWGLARHWRRRDGGGWAGMKAVSVDGGRLRELVNGLRPPGRLIFFWLGMAFLSVALARPQLGYVELPRFEQSREVMVALDLSKSMWADDVKPSRLDRSRLLVDNLLDYLKGERVGMVLFAGTAFTQSPLSADYEVLREFLPELSPEYLPQGGTNYAAMLDVVLESFSQGPDSAADRYLIILSDGESLSDEWQSRIEALKEAGVKIIGLGVGTSAGAVIQDPSGGVIKDQSGSVVLSRLNASTLQALARETGGEYRQADRWLDLPDLLMRTIEKGRKGEFSENRDRKPMERYQIPLLIGLLSFLLSLWREYPVRPRVSGGAQTVHAVDKNLENNSGNRNAEPTAAVPPPLPVALIVCSLLSMSAWGQQMSSASDPAQQLSAAVAQLSQQDSLSAKDHAELAQVTVNSGKAILQSGSSLPRGAVEDGLEAVFEGETLDASAADWETLRKELEELLEQTPEEQDQEQQQDQNQEQDQQSQQDQQNQNSSQNDSSQDGQQNQNQEQQQSQDSQSSESSGESNENQQQSKPQDSGQENQKNEQNSESQSDENSERENQQPEQGQASERNEQNQMGPMNQEEKSDDGKPSQPKPEQGKPQKLQTIKGTSNEGSQSQSKDPAVVAAMKELSDVKDRDVPAELFQRMQTDQQPRQQGKDW